MNTLKIKISPEYCLYDNRIYYKIESWDIVENDINIKVNFDFGSDYFSCLEELKENIDDYIVYSSEAEEYKDINFSFEIDGVDPSKIVSAKVNCDYETGERCGAGGFQICSLTFIDENENVSDLSYLVDQGLHFYDMDSVDSYLQNNLGLNIYIEEV